MTALTDAAGNLVSALVYDANGNLQGPGTDNPVVRYQWNATTQSYERRYYHTDALGSVVALSDDQGTLSRSNATWSDQTPTSICARSGVSAIQTHGSVLGRGIPLKDKASTSSMLRHSRTVAVDARIAHRRRIHPFPTRAGPAR